MAPYPWIDVVIILVLVAVNGVFAMSELAIASSRKARLEAMARTGSRGARAAIDLAADPGKFLSTAQVGITLIAILSGAYSGEALGGPTALRLQSWFGSERGDREHRRVRARDRRHDLRLADRRRARAQADRAALARADRGGGGDPDGVAVADRRADRVAARFDQQAAVLG